MTSEVKLPVDLRGRKAGRSVFSQGSSLSAHLWNTKTQMLVQPWAIELFLLYPGFQVEMKDCSSCIVSSC